MPSHLCLAHYGPGLIRYQTGACIVRQAQEQTGSDYIRPDTVPSKPGSDARRFEIHNNVRWGMTHMGDRNTIRKRQTSFYDAPGKPCFLDASSTVSVEPVAVQAVAYAA